MAAIVALRVGLWLLLLGLQHAGVVALDDEGWAGDEPHEEVAQGRDEGRQCTEEGHRLGAELVLPYQATCKKQM